MKSRPDKLLAYKHGRVDWKQVEDNLRRFYSRQWISREITQDQAVSAARGIPEMIKELKREYYRLRRKMRDGEID